MGYELHITRKTSWMDPEVPAIALADWQKLVEGDTELSWSTEVGPEDLKRTASYKNQKGAMRWDDGQILAGDANKALIKKMVALAGKLSATVQGDDGEIYKADGTSEEPVAPPPPAPSLMGSIRQWFQRRKVRKDLEKSLPQFAVGKRVRDAWGFRGTLIKISKSGAGELVVKYDDGRQQTFAYIASGLELEEALQPAGAKPSN